MSTRNDALDQDFDDDVVELPMRSGLMSVTQAAAYLGVSERWLYDEIRDGKLAAMYIARAWRIRPEVLDAYADTFRAKPSTVRRRGQVRALNANQTGR